LLHGCFGSRVTSHQRRVFGTPVSGSRFTVNGFSASDGRRRTQIKTEDFEHIGVDRLHQLQRAWELYHRILTAEAVARHTLFRKETRWPGYYYRADHPKLDDTDWHVFTGSKYDATTGEWQMSKLPVHHFV